jgi:predicted nucleic acid-binding protein
VILADTSVWVAHLKQPNGHPDLVAALEQGVAVGHPLVEGELLLSGAPVDALLSGVAMLPMAPHAEVRAFVEQLGRPVHRIGWIDVHLVYSALVHHCKLLTGDGPQRELFRRCRL